MKYVVLTAALVSACTISKPPAAMPVEPLRAVELVLHADASISPYRRSILDLAAAKVRRLTNNRGFVTVQYDLDFDSVENLQHHMNVKSSIILDVPTDGDIANSIDRRHPGRQVLAETSIREGGRVVIVFMPERYERIEDLRIAMHELAHAVGIDDTTAVGCVMTGSSEPQSRILTEFQECDKILCREARLCN